MLLVLLLILNIIAVCSGDLLLLTWCGKPVPVPFRDEVQKGGYIWLVLLKLCVDIDLL